jgi:2-keto-3-deoxy-L-rhamnonate aldolase RhmA
MRMEKKAIGIWQQIPLPMISRLLAKMGWEWIILDMQHGCMNYQTAYECIHTIRAHGARPLVRTPIGAPSDVQKALDLGAAGVVAPMVNSAAEARLLAQAAKYPPRGGRSVGGDSLYTIGPNYMERADEETLLLAQIEHIDAVHAVEEILSVDGVDGCFVGPTDLALSMGLGRTGFDADPAHRAAIQKTVDVCRRLGKLACSNSYSLTEAREKAAQGYDFVTLRSDEDLFWTAGCELVQGMKEMQGETWPRQAVATS